jgi:UDP-glucuronate 4-epimerase
MTVLVTGAAGFIGFHVARKLLAKGRRVVGVDNLNDYYDPALKQARLDVLEAEKGFTFHRANIAERDGMLALADEHPDVSGIVHLAAQAGVRYSLVNPYAYVEANVMGQLVMLELARRFEKLDHMVYASSSSVYGGNRKLPFSESDPADTPVSLYAATKRADELMAATYRHLYDLPLTGLRFFTVYGPWGRPDMAAFSFTRDILAGKSIRLFNYGDMRRDFTYIDDIVDGVLAALARRPAAGTSPVYNLGNHHAENLRHFLAVLEDAIGRKAEVDLQPMQPGDVYETYADIAAAQADLAFEPKTRIEEGLPRFVAWYRDFYGI